jgi:hypothetical protein
LARARGAASVPSERGRGQRRRAIPACAGVPVVTGRRPGGPTLDVGGSWQCPSL